ncbi:zinc-binding dehydrogenase, partial [Ameyamaea chiangmaiensis]
DPDATPDLAAAIVALTGEGADVVFDLIGTRAALVAATGMLRRRGRLILLGYTEQTYDIHPVDLIVREITVRGSVGASLEDLHEAVALMARGVLRFDIADIVPLDAFDDALARVRAGGLTGRVVLDTGSGAV